MKIVARAKVNLFLQVMNRRPDDYHDIRSVLVPISLADNIVFEKTSGALEMLAPAKVRLKGMPAPASIGAPEDNLAYKAARLLQESAGCRWGARIRLEKKVPVAGGLGGGSADAASTLTALNRLWDTGLSREDLMSLAARLGCDIPALVHGGAVCMTGRGEIVSPVAWRRGWHPWLLLVNPGFGVSTGDIYGRYRPGLTSAPKKTTFDNLLAALARGDAAGMSAGLFNTLQATVFDKFPLLEIIREKMVKIGCADVLLSGTGATIFAVVANREHGREMEKSLRNELDCGLWTSVVRVMGDQEE